MRSEKDYPVAETAAAALDENSAYAKVVALTKPGMRVADVGCGPGNIARLLKERGCTVVGVDSNAEALDTARAYCERVIAADLDREPLDAVLRGESFDAIVFADVLEHLRDPSATLRGSRGLLRDGGTVLASIPNIAHGAIRLALLLGDFDYQPLGILDDTHLRFFTRKTVDRLFAECGFTIETLDRTLLPIFGDSELVPRLEEDDFPPGLVDAVDADEEAETLQFIVLARPLEGGEVIAPQLDDSRNPVAAALGAGFDAGRTEPGHSALRRRLIADLERRFGDLEASYRRLEDFLGNERAAHDQTRQTFAALEAAYLALERRVSALEIELAATNEEIEIERSKTAQAFAQLTHEQTRALRLRAEVESLNAQIREMRRSKFWRIRNLYFRLLHRPT